MPRFPFWNAPLNPTWLAGTQGSNDVTPAVLLEFIQECEHVLSSTHHLTLNALRLMVNLCTSLAYLRIERYLARGGLDDSNYKTDAVAGYYFRMSVWAGFRLVLACECVTVNCVGCGMLVIGGGSHDSVASTDHVNEKNNEFARPTQSFSLGAIDTGI